MMNLIRILKDAKLIGETIRMMKREKVPLATMDDKDILTYTDEYAKNFSGEVKISEDFKKTLKHIILRTHEIDDPIRNLEADSELLLRSAKQELAKTNIYVVLSGQDGHICSPLFWDKSHAQKRYEELIKEACNPNSYYIHELEIF